MDINAVMDQIGTQLDTISGLRVYDYLADSVAPPAAIVYFPQELEFDQTYGRGMDRLTLPILVVVGRVSDRASRDKLVAYANGSGSSSIKAVVESGTYTAFHTVRVTMVEFDIARINEVDYAGALFMLDIAGQGA